MKRQNVISYLLLITAAAAPIHAWRGPGGGPNDLPWTQTRPHTVAPEAPLAPSPSFEVGPVRTYPVSTYSRPAVANAYFVPVSQLIEQAPDLTTFAALLMTTGFMKTLASGGPYTVIAPTNAAFENFYAQTNLTLNDLLDFRNRSTIDALIKNHILHSDLQNRDFDRAAPMASSVKTQADTTLDLQPKGDGAFVVSIQGNNALGAVATPVDLPGVGKGMSNGAVFKIDQVLIPERLKATLNQYQLFDGDTANADDIGDINPLD